MNIAPLILASYLLGSISFGIVICRLMGLPDPRGHGSGNPGATNVLRSGKKLAAFLTLLGDAAKGWLPVWLALQWGQSVGVVCLLALAVFLGHVFPVYYGFKGGKGVATAAGILFAFSPWLGLLVMATWILAFAIWRISSLSALIAAIFSPIYASQFFGLSLTTATVVVLATMLLWRHQSNIKRLLSGEEGGFGKPKT